MNNCGFSGRLTAEPELKQTLDGVSVCSFTLAVKRPHVKDKVDFINFVAWRHDAEYLCTYGHKGSWVEVAGRLTGRRWEDSGGKKRISYEVVCDTMQIVSSHSSNPDNQSSLEDVSLSEDAGAFEDASSDDQLPF